MAVYRMDPIGDARWPAFLEQHPGASIFHTPGWLEALRRTYGYEPLALTTSTPGEPLVNGMVFCRIQSWLTGCRLVSLPFSDYCQPLVDDPESLLRILRWLEQGREREEWKYVELRPMWCDAQLDAQTRFGKGATFYRHTIDLRPDPEAVFRGFHKNCIQRKIQRAEREGLAYEAGRSESLLAKFYRLLLLTRRRHKLPPQPLVWFRNLVACMGNNLTIRVVSKNDSPVASILTLSHGKKLVYKYGCSDASFHNLGGMPLLFWKAMQERKALGAVEFDLGRSEADASELITFKEHLGAVGSQLRYYRYPAVLLGEPATDWRKSLVQHACARLPDSVLIAAGRLLYRHVG